MPVSRRQFAASALPSLSLAQARRKQPDIVFILIDDSRGKPLVLPVRLEQVRPLLE